MRVARFLVAALSIAVPAVAHPPVSVVIDRSGNVFYSDLAQVWRVAPDGTKSVAVPDVHTHELALDAAGNLYGERAEYSGEATNLYHFSIWLRATDGRLTTVVPRTK